MHNYELKLDPYDQGFDKQIETPMSWWLSIKDKYNYLYEIAIMIFSITPHSAGCERIFSTLGWLYGKRRQRLGLLKIEAMAKIRSFYISNIKNELAYIGQQYSEDELHKMIDDSTFLQFEEEEEEKEEENNNIPLEIPTHEVRVLIIEQLFDLKDIDIANNEDLSNDENDNETNSNNNSNSDSNSSDDDNNYDIELLTQKYLLNDEIGETL